VLKQKSKGQLGFKSAGSCTFLKGQKPFLKGQNPMTFGHPKSPWRAGGGIPCLLQQQEMALLSRQAFQGCMHAVTDAISRA
jgi:hypothetical protein